VVRLDWNVGSLMAMAASWRKPMIPLFSSKLIIRLAETHQSLQVVGVGVNRIGTE